MNPEIHRVQSEYKNAPRNFREARKRILNCSGDLEADFNSFSVSDVIPSNSKYLHENSFVGKENSHNKIVFPIFWKGNKVYLSIVFTWETSSIGHPANSGSSNYNGKIHYRLFDDKCNPVAKDSYPAGHFEEMIMKQLEKSRFFYNLQLHFSHQVDKLLSSLKRRD